MGLGMRPKVGFPTPPRWATDASTTTEPTESRKDTGATANQKPPAKEWNWLLNAQYEQMQRANAVTFGNYWHGETGFSDSFRYTVYHPEVDLWIIGSSSEYRQSWDGKEWSTNLVLTSNASSSCAGIDSTRFIVCNNVNGELNYNTDITSLPWSQETVTGMTVLPSCFCTKYPDSDYIVVLGQGEAFLSTTGIGGTWLPATTPPPTAADIRSVCRTATNTFVCIDDNGYVFDSTDGGDTWAAVTVSPRDAIANFSPGQMACNTDDDNDSPVLCAVGLVSLGNGSIARSIDGGDTWAESTVNMDLNTDNVEALNAVYYVGGKIWVATGNGLTENRACIYISRDNAATWTRAIYNSVGTFSSPANLHGIGCNGRQLVISGQPGINLHSLAYPG